MKKVLLTNDGIDVWATLLTPLTGYTTVLCASLKYTFLLAKNIYGQYCFIVDLPSSTPDTASTSPMKGIKVDVVKSGDIRPKLVLELKDKQNWAIFKLLCQELIREGEQVNSLKNLASVVLGTIERFRNFYQKSKSKITEEKVKGLLGELIFLKNIAAPEVGWTNALNGWRGPLGAPQDFSLSNTVVEVKTKDSDSKNIISITSADQLSTCSKRGYLHVIYICKAAQEEEQNSSFSLLELTDKVRKELLHNGASISTFDTLLGHIFTDELQEDEAKLLKTRFIVISSESFIFTDQPSFPKITTDKLIPGTLNVTYNIDLSHCEQFKQKISII